MIIYFVDAVSWMRYGKLEDPQFIPDKTDVVCFSDMVFKVHWRQFRYNEDGHTTVELFVDLI